MPNIILDITARKNHRGKFSATAVDKKIVKKIISLLRKEYHIIPKNRIQSMEQFERKYFPNTVFTTCSKCGGTGRVEQKN